MWIFNGKPKRGSNQLGLYLLICLLSIQVLAGDGKVDLTVPISRARARDIGIQIVIYQPGVYYAITDVSGVKVGHVTLNEGNSIRTGVTAVIPRDNIWKNRLFGASYAIHGNGETTGMARINQAGWIESPIMLTNTLSVGAVHDGVDRHTIKHYPDEHEPAMYDLILPIEAECYDGVLNDISGLHVTADHTIQAIEKAKSGWVAEGCVGGGTGMRCYGFKAGIGTASRILPEKQGGYTVGVLVNSNGGRRLQLRIDGVPVGQEMTDSKIKSYRDGSFIVVVATDAPLVHRQLMQLAKRATNGLARTGTPSTVSSGEFVIAFSTANVIPLRPENGTFALNILADYQLDGLYQAVVETTEEAIVNSMTTAVTTTGRKGRIIKAIPLDHLQAVMKKYGR